MLIVTICEMLEGPLLLGSNYPEVTGTLAKDAAAAAGVDRRIAEGRRRADQLGRTENRRVPGSLALALGRYLSSTGAGPAAGHGTADGDFAPSSPAGGTTDRPRPPGKSP